MTLVEFLQLFPQAFKEWVHDRANGLAASIAFYQLMSMPPFIALIVLASSAIFGMQMYKSEVEPMVEHFFHPQFIAAVKYMVQYSYKLDASKFWTITILAVASLIHGTLGFFEQIKDSVETFWGVRTDETNIKTALKNNLEGLFMGSVSISILLTGFIVIHWFRGSEGGTFLLIGMLVEFLVFLALFFFLLSYCPPLKVNWKEVLPGVLITAILYMLGRIGLGYVLGKNEHSSEDVAAALILYLLWAYYSSLIFLYGAEFSKVYIEKIRKKPAAEMILK